jgi:hypothetical protein
MDIVDHLSMACYLISEVLEECILSHPTNEVIFFLLGYP